MPAVTHPHPAPKRAVKNPVSASRLLPSTLVRPALGLAVCGVALFGAASVAAAAEVTNPADHPAPVSVKIDGQSYSDGLDTLPGYDDYACTPIPNVEYDFAENQIL